jgi:hypothetical protein
MSTTFLSSLKALAVLLEAVAFDAVAASLVRLLLQSHRFSVPAVATTHTKTILAAGLSGPEALTVLGLTVALDTAASKPPPGGHLAEQVINFRILYI